MSSDLALRISNLHKTYSNGFKALKGISLDVKKGDFMALLGPNGAGKSTTIGIVCSLVNKSQGHVEVFGHDMDKELSKVKQCIGLVPQEFNFNQFEKVYDIVITQAGYYGIPASVAHERARKYLMQLGLWDKKDAVSRELSGGMKRRLMIARALVHEPDLLILDEPTAGVDIELRRSMWEFLQAINKEGKTIILTTHYLEEAESLCRNIAIIDQGQLVKSTDMKSLLATLDVESFLLDFRDPVSTVSLTGYQYNLMDGRCLEVDVPKAQSLNGVFEQLSEQGIKVVSMRNKANRLEELFLSLLDSNAEKES